MRMRGNWDCLAKVWAYVLNGFRFPTVPKLWLFRARVSGTDSRFFRLLDGVTE